MMVLDQSSLSLSGSFLRVVEMNVMEYSLKSYFEAGLVFRRWMC